MAGEKREADMLAWTTRKKVVWKSFAQSFWPSCTPLPAELLLGFLDRAFLYTFSRPNWVLPPRETTLDFRRPKTRARGRTRARGLNYMRANSESASSFRLVNLKRLKQRASSPAGSAGHEPRDRQVGAVL